MRVGSFAVAESLMERITATLIITGMRLLDSRDAALVGHGRLLI